MSGFFAFFKTLWEIISGIKLMIAKWLDAQVVRRRNKYKEGVAEGDTTKVEESFDSDQAGKPDKIGDVEWDDEKTK